MKRLYWKTIATKTGTLFRSMKATTYAIMFKRFESSVCAFKTQEVKHRQAERNYSSNLSLGQKYIQKELRTLFNLTESETQKAQINLLDRVFKNHLSKI